MHRYRLHNNILHYRLLFHSIHIIIWDVFIIMYHQCQIHNDNYKNSRELVFYINHATYSWINTHGDIYKIHWGYLTVIIISSLVWEVSNTHTTYVLSWRKSTLFICIHVFPGSMNGNIPDKNTCHYENRANNAGFVICEVTLHEYKQNTFVQDVLTFNRCFVCWALVFY